jgi:hypothetical protein
MLTPLFTSTRTRGLALLLGLLLAATPAAQSPQTLPAALARQDWTKIDEELKGLLSEYYVGKPVRAKVVIPATRRGLEIVDGELRAAPVGDPRGGAQPGDLLLITRISFKSKTIEVYFNGSDEEGEPEPVKTQATAPPLLAPVGSFGSEATEALRKGGTVLAPTAPPPAAARLAQPPARSPKRAPNSPSEPRITLRFSREINTRDLNLQSINRLLAPALDVTGLIPKETAPRAVAETTPAPRPDAAMLAERAANAQGIPTAQLTGSIVTAQPNVCELQVESSVEGARLYIDGAFSGATPRTVRLLMGVHTVLIAAPGYEAWEQRFFAPPGKAAVIRAQLKPVPK